jgi:thiosulfate reductase cytochrome b subunit
VESAQHGSSRQIHPLVVRLTHWLNALAIAIMVTSGWRIYNASPLFSFKIPGAMTLGGWLGGALQWHFAAMWLLAANGLIYLVYGIVSGHFRRKFWPISPRAVFADIVAALHGKLSHADLSIYNAAQRAAYATLILGSMLLVVSGLAISGSRSSSPEWRPLWAATKRPGLCISVP